MRFILILYNRKQINQLFTLVCFYFLFATNINAAVQGTEGFTSTGSMDIVVVVGELALINGLNDINLGAWPGTGDLSGTDNMCVAVTGAAFNQPKNYHLRASGNGDASNPGAFTLSNGVKDIYYRVYLDDLNGQVELLPGQISYSNQFLANTGYILNLIFGGCFFPNALVTVVAEEAELASGSGTHTGVLTLELIPE